MLNTSQNPQKDCWVFWAEDSTLIRNDAENFLETILLSKHLNLNQLNGFVSHLIKNITSSNFLATIKDSVENEKIVEVIDKRLTELKKNENPLRLFPHLSGIPENVKSSINSTLPKTRGSSTRKRKLPPEEGEKRKKRRIDETSNNQVNLIESFLDIEHPYPNSNTSFEQYMPAQGQSYSLYYPDPPQQYPNSNLLPEYSEQYMPTQSQDYSLYYPDITQSYPNSNLLSEHSEYSEQYMPTQSQDYLLYYPDIAQQYPNSNLLSEHSEYSEYSEQYMPTQSQDYLLYYPDIAQQYPNSNLLSEHSEQYMPRQSQGFPYDPDTPQQHGNNEDLSSRTMEFQHDFITETTPEAIKKIYNKRKNKLLLSEEQSEKIHTFLLKNNLRFTEVFSSVEDIIRLINCGISPNKNGLKSLDSVLQGILGSLENLKILSSLGFSAPNIRSMLKNSGDRLTNDIQTLLEFAKPLPDSDDQPDYSQGQHTLLSYLIEQGFKAENISSMLSGSGSKLAENIQSLLRFFEPLQDFNSQPIPVAGYDSNGQPDYSQGQHTLLSYLIEQGFKAENISSMLNGSGSKLAENIQSLLRFFEPLQDSNGYAIPIAGYDSNGQPDYSQGQHTLLSYLIEQGFKTKNISSILYTSRSMFAENIQTLLKCVKPVQDSSGYAIPIAGYDSNGQPDYSQGQHTLLSYLIKQGLSTKIIASMLRRSRGKLAENIQTLLEFIKPLQDSNEYAIPIAGYDSNSQPDYSQGQHTLLSYLIKQGLMEEIISSMLNGSAANLLENIQTLLELVKPLQDSNGHAIPVAGYYSNGQPDYSRGKHTQISYLIEQGLNVKDIIKQGLNTENINSMFNGLIENLHQPIYENTQVSTLTFFNNPDRFNHDDENPTLHRVSFRNGGFDGRDD